jgi:hypothetical protein
MVADDARVWQLLDEQVIAPFPINADNLAEPLIPQISVLHARCQRIETGIEVVWGVSTTRGARNYEADLSYDSGATWEVLSPYGPASSGRAQLRQSDKPVTVRARAFGRTGLPGDYVSTTFTTVAPLIDNNQVELRLPPIDYEGLTQDVRNRIDYILTVEQRALAAAATAGDALEKAVASLRNDEANQAAIVSEQTARIADGVAFTSRIDGAISRIGSAEAAIVTESTTRATADSAQATRIDGLQVRVGNSEVQLVTQEQARIDADGILGQRIEAVRVTANDASAAVIGEASIRFEQDRLIATNIDVIVGEVRDPNTGIPFLKGAIINEAQVRLENDTVLSTNLNFLVAEVRDPNTGISAAFAAVGAEQTARANAVGALASRVDSVQARTDAGTATGRMTLSARSDISGVSARFEMLLAAEVGGAIRGTGMTFDLLPGGGSLVRFDADKFVITSPGVSGVPAFSFDAGSGTLSVPYLRLTSGQASVPLRIDIGSYTLIAGAGTVNDQIDANLNFNYSVSNPDFPANIEVFGNLTISGPAGTQLLGMRLIVDGKLAGFFRFNEQNTFVSVGPGNNSFFFRCSCIRFLPAGTRSVRIQYSYTSPGAGQVQINELYLAGFQPKA